MISKIRCGIPLNGEEENFFGAVVGSRPVAQALELRHVVADAPSQARLEVSLQGATQVAHRVRVSLNGVMLGELSYEKQEGGEAQFQVPHSLLREGENEVLLESIGGANDASLIRHLRLSYEHALRRGERRRARV